MRKDDESCRCGRVAGASETVDYDKEVVSAQSRTCAQSVAVGLVRSVKSAQQCPGGHCSTAVRAVAGAASVGTAACEDSVGGVVPDTARETMLLYRVEAW